MSFPQPSIDPPRTPAEFQERLLAARLLADSLQNQLRERSASLLEMPVHDYAAFLVHQKVVTRWQADELLKGRTGFFVEGYKLLVPHFQTTHEALFVAEQVAPQKLVLLHFGTDQHEGRTVTTIDFMECVTLAAWTATGPEIAPSGATNLLRQVELATRDWEAEGLRRAGANHVLLSDQGPVQVLGPLRSDLAFGDTTRAVDRARQGFLLRLAQAMGLPGTNDPSASLDAGRSQWPPAIAGFPNFVERELIPLRRTYFHPFIRKSPPIAHLAPHLATLQAVEATCFASSEANPPQLGPIVRPDRSREAPLDAEFTATDIEPPETRSPPADEIQFDWSPGSYPEELAPAKLQTQRKIRSRSKIVGQLLAFAAMGLIVLGLWFWRQGSRPLQGATAAPMPHQASSPDPPPKPPRPD